MKAMILAAGFGTRMGALTHDIPKPLLCVAGKPLIVHHIENLVKHSITHIVINLHYHADKIMAALGSGKTWGATLHYSYEPILLNTGGGVAQALPLLGSDPFWVISSDIYTDFAFHPPTLSLFDTTDENNNLAHIYLSTDPTEHADFNLENNRITLEHPQYTYSGIAYVKPALFASLDINQPYPIGKLFEIAIRNQQATGEILSSAYWINIGTPEKLAQTNAFKAQ